MKSITWQTFEKRLSSRIEKLELQMRSMRVSAGIDSSCLPPEFLYHYTTAEGLIGILENWKDQCCQAKIWATQSDYLNDYKEMELGHDLVKSAVQEVETYARGSIPSQLLLNELQRRLLEHDPVYFLFIACFCGPRSGNLLSQWRAYGNGGGGYSIGLRPEKKEVWQVPQGYELFKVIYNRDLQAKMIKTVIEKYSETVENFWPSCDSVKADLGLTRPTVIVKLAANLLRDVKLMFHCFKHRGFSEEDEYRLVYARPHPRGLDVKFRTSNGILIPYVDLPLHLTTSQKLGNFTVRSIMHGPSMHPLIAKKSVGMWRSRLPYGNFPIESSGIPYQQNLAYRPYSEP